jgi:hypothetical protein
MIDIVNAEMTPALLRDRLPSAQQGEDAFFVQDETQRGGMSRKGHNAAVP